MDNRSHAVNSIIIIINEALLASLFVLFIFCGRLSTGTR